MKTIITAGEEFADIDVLACAIAYSELLTLEGKESEVVLPGVLNGSITPAIRKWNLKYVTEPTESDSDVVIVDVSELAYVAKFVKPEQVVEVYDHRFGFQDFWKEKLGDNTHIEFVGACATLIWEEYKKRGYAEQISTLSANLLSIAILSNTLNFGASVTDQRDLDAFEELKKFIDLPSNWAGQYFEEVEKEIYMDVEKAIKSDTKDLSLSNLNLSILMGQMELWNSNNFLDKYAIQVGKVLESFGNPKWIMSLPSISEKRNYLYTRNDEIKKLFSKIIPVVWNGDIGVTDKLWLRKEIRKKLLEI